MGEEVSACVLPYPVVIEQSPKGNNTAATPTAGNAFGSSPFGGGGATTGGNLFGGGTSTTPAASNIFGGNGTNANNAGGAAAAPQPNAFGGGGGLFGAGNQTSTPASGGGLFGGGAASSTFGSKPAEQRTATQPAPQNRTCLGCDLPMLCMLTLFQFLVEHQQHRALQVGQPKHSFSYVVNTILDSSCLWWIIWFICS